MGFNNTKIWIPLEIVRAAFLNEFWRLNFDYFKGIQVGQTEVEIEAMVVSDNRFEVAKNDFIPGQLFVGNGDGLGEIGVKLEARDINSPTSIQDGQYSGLVGLVGESTTETSINLGGIRFIRDGADSGKLEVTVRSNSGTDFNTPVWQTGKTGNTGIKTGFHPTYKLDVNGNVTASAILKNGNSIAEWTETPPGTADYSGNAETDGQWISTVATGTAPISVLNTGLNLNLNAEFLKGLKWPTTADGYAQNSATGVVIGTTLTTITSVTLNRSGKWVFLGHISYDVLGNDKNQIFTLSLSQGTTQSKDIETEENIQICCSVFSRGNLASGQVVNLQAIKSGGTGSSVGTGILTAFWIGP